MSNKQKIQRALRERAQAQPVAARIGRVPSDGPTVAVGYLYGQDVAAGFANSLGALLWAQGMRRDRTLVTEVLAEACGVNVAGGRNRLMVRFLETACDWLLMLDADMTFKPDLPDALLAMANPDPDAEHYAPIVGGLCFGVDNGDLFPTLYDFVPGPTGEPKTVRYEQFPADTMFQVGATGAACLLIHRSVVEAIKAKGFDSVYPWFQETTLSGERCGEDITFCLRAAYCEFPVYVNTAVDIGHQKAHVLTLDQYRAQRAAAGKSADVRQEATP